jgi:hypothetical protein
MAMTKADFKKTLDSCRAKSGEFCLLEVRALGPTADPAWPRGAGVLAHLTGSPVVELNRAVAFGMAYGPGSDLTGPHGSGQVVTDTIQA